MFISFDEKFHKNPILGINNSILVEIECINIKYTLPIYIIGTTYVYKPNLITWL